MFSCMLVWETYISIDSNVQQGHIPSRKFDRKMAGGQRGHISPQGLCGQGGTTGALQGIVLELHVCTKIFHMNIPVNQSQFAPGWSMEVFLETQHSSATFPACIFMDNCKWCPDIGLSWVVYRQNCSRTMACNFSPPTHHSTTLGLWKDLKVFFQKSPVYQKNNEW